MSDAEITRRCALALGFKPMFSDEKSFTDHNFTYPSPLLDDAMMTKLLKKYPIECVKAINEWLHDRLCRDWEEKSLDLNRAVSTAAAERQAM